MFAKKLLVAAGVLGLGTAAVAQDYFDFGRIPGLPDQPAVQVELTPGLLAFARETTRATDPATADLLSSIDGVRVRVYHSPENADDIQKYIDEAASRLERADWQPIVNVQDDEQVRIYMKGDEESITGLTAMILDDNNAVFVNVAGTIRPEQLAQLIQRAGNGELLDSLRGSNFGLNFGNSQRTDAAALPAPQ